MEEKFIEQLIKSRHWETEEDFDFWLELGSKIANEYRDFSLKSYFYGFVDSSFGDYPTLEYLELVFGLLQNIPINYYSLEETIISLLNNVELFLPHAKQCYGIIVIYILFHYSKRTESKNSYELFIFYLSNIDMKKRRLIGNILNENTKIWFGEQEINESGKNYQDIIDFCLQ